MLKKTFEWLRVVDPTPSDEKVLKRTNAAVDVLQLYTEADNYDIVCHCASAVIMGFSGNDNESSFVSDIIDIVRRHQPAFPSSLSENSIELRVLCAIVLGEIISSDKADYGQGPELGATLVISGVDLRTPASELYLTEVQNELRELSYSTLEGIAEQARNVDEIDLNQLKALSPVAGSETADVEDDEEAENKLAINKLVPLLQGYFNALQKQSNANREELEVLWWLYNGFSETIKKPLIVLEGGQAAIACGVEIANMTLCPPLMSVRHLVIRAVTTGRESVTADVTLTTFVGSWDRSIWMLLIPNDPKTKAFIAEHAALFPLSWISIRLNESAGGTSWREDFHSKTGIDPEKAVSLSGLALQAFNERVAQKLYLQTLGDDL